MKLKLRDIVRLKKKHPCGSYEWQVIRLGADIGIRCQKCQRQILMERRLLEKKVKAVIPSPPPGSPEEDQWSETGYNHGN
jgi:hypothetical protein